MEFNVGFLIYSSLKSEDDVVVLGEVEMRLKS